MNGVRGLLTEGYVLSCLKRKRLPWMGGSLQVYLNWVNSVLNDVGSTACIGVTSIQEGRIVCQLIDKLCPSINLQQNVRNSGNTTPHGYLRAALDHMRSQGIKFHFTPQDILDGDIKSILDVLWLIILNYSVHSIGSSPYQRSVGIGKKLLLDWCRQELQEEFDPQNSLTYNLCTGDWFLKLLTKNSDRHLKEDIDREENLQSQLTAIEYKYGIKHNLISPSDITEGTVDEHTLMIYISLLRLKIGDSGDDPLQSPHELSFQSVEHSVNADSVTSEKPPEVPSIVLSEVDSNKSPSPETVLEPVQTFASSPQSVSAGSSPTQSLPQGTDPETSDWMSQSSGSPMSSFHDKLFEQKSPEITEEVESVLKETISKHVEEHITPRDDGMQDDSSKHSSRIPIRIKEGDESQRPISNPGLIQGENIDKTVTRKISIKVQRPRSPNSIMAEARARQEQEKERKWREKVEVDRQKREEKDEPVMTGSASEADMSDLGPRVKYHNDADPVKSDEDDIVKDRQYSASVSLPNFVQMNGDIHNGVPVFVMPGQKHDVELLLEALKHARTEASVQDHLIHHAPADQPNFKHVVDKNIEQLEAQLAAVKAQSKEIFEDHNRKPEAERGRAPVKETNKARRGEGHSPPRGILDMMVNQNVQPDETNPKDRMHEEGRSTPQSILRNRGRSPTDHARRFAEDGFVREGLYSRDKCRSTSPYQNMTDGEDADKRLIKFLTNEIENMKLKMAVMEQKNEQRSKSPCGIGPRISSGLPERERSPAQISSRARARFSDLGSYSPTRRARSTELIDEIRSRSPRFDSPGRSPSRSPTRSPVSMYRSHSPDRISLSRERIRPISPSARVLSLQDLSTSITDDVDGNWTFSPASGAKPVSLGYSSPIRKVNDEIWGYGQTDDDYYADTAKFDDWKILISREAVTDEDSLELKQALASALVELNILQAKLKNANSDIKDKMGKTTEVLNDCRAQISKSQAENAELRGQLEREKQNREMQELRIKEMEQNLHSTKTNQDDKTLELEESVITLKGIVNLDKNHMSQLEDDNVKLRRKFSEFQRENIKLKEDFNELKMYTDKAQQTIKDLKSCLEDARTERNQLVAEIKKLKDQGKNSAVSSIVNHYMEKGLYEDTEKDHVADRARSRSPNRFMQPRSVSPTFSRPITPIRTSSPVRKSEPSYMPAYIPMSRSQTPTTDCSFNYEDISPGDGHEIYPHRRMRSYVEKFGVTDLPSSQVDLNDPEIQELLKPKTKLTYDLDLNDNQDTGPQAKRKLMYSPYMDKDFVPKSNQNGFIEKDNNFEHESLPTKKETSHRKSSMEEELESRKFINALDHAVMQTPAQLAQQHFLQEITSAADDDGDRWRSPYKGILKNTKSAQNMSIKESITPSRRSFESRSYSPSVRSPLTYTSMKSTARSFTPDPVASRSRSYATSTPVRPTYTSNTAQPRSYSPSNNRNRSQSPRNVGQRSYSPGSRSYSPGYRGNTIKDSGYNSPTQPCRYRSSIANDNRDYSRPRTPTSSRSHTEKKKSGLLSDEERRYADLLIDKYTRQHIIGIPLASS